jgi:SAM-dependent methyltransferase
VGRWDSLWSQVQDISVVGLDREIWRQLSGSICFRQKSVLELGCGRGLQSRFALEAGARCATLVDSSPEALRLAQLLLSDVGDVAFVQQDLLQFRAERKFDIVLSSGVVEHFRGEELQRCLQVHRDHARELVAIVVPSTPHVNELCCRTRRFRDTFGYERPISVRRMASLLRGVGLRPRVLKRFFPLYNAHAYWLGPRTGIQRADRRLDRWYAKLDSWLGRKGIRDGLVPAFRRFDRALGGALLAVAEPEGSGRTGGAAPGR